MFISIIVMGIYDSGEIICRNWNVGVVVVFRLCEVFISSFSGIFISSVRNKFSRICFRFISMCL